MAPAKRIEERIEDEAKEFLLNDENLAVRNEAQEIRRLKRWLGFTTSLAGIFCCTTALLSISIWKVTMTAFKVETGFPTDFVSDDPGIEIDMVQRHFTSDLRFNETSGTLYNEIRYPGEPRWIGEPSPELDKTWQDLLHAQYMYISPSEALQFPEEDRETIDYHGKRNFMELSVYHNLHCLNKLRMEIDKDYYAAKDPEGGLWGGRVHNDHCIDQIRQALECHGDTTPVPMLAATEGVYIGNAEMHTCRDFSKIRKWVDERTRKQMSLGDLG